MPGGDDEDPASSRAGEQEGDDSQARREHAPQASDSDKDEIVICGALPEPQYNPYAPGPRPDYNKPLPFVLGPILFQEPGKDMKEVMELQHACAERRRQHEAAVTAAGIVKRRKVTIRRFRTQDLLFPIQKHLPDMP